LFAGHDLGGRKTQKRRSLIDTAGLAGRPLEGKPAAGHRPLTSGTQTL